MKIDEDEAAENFACVIRGWLSEAQGDLRRYTNEYETYKQFKEDLESRVADYEAALRVLEEFVQVGSKP